MGTSGPVRAGVVLVEYHSGGLVAERVAQCEGLGLVTVVADNSGSYEGGGHVVDTGGNVGFGPGCNRAVAALPDTVDVVVLMNPDVRIDQPHLLQMVDLVAAGGWDVLAPVTRTPSGTREGFTLPGPWRELGLTAREWAQRRRPSRGVVPSSGRPPTAPSAIGVRACPPDRFGSAALLVVRRSAFAGVGGFDESFFLYVEDADLWERLVASGARAGFVGDAVLEHDSGTGSRGSTDRRVALRRLGIEHYLALRGRRWRIPRFLHRCALPSGTAGDAILAAIEQGYRHGRTPAEIQAAVRSVALAESAERA